MYICICQKISDSLIKEKGIEECISHLGMGSCCGKCLEHIRYQPSNDVFLVNSLSIAIDDGGKKVRRE